jgi:hypothetical protein
MAVALRHISWAAIAIAASITGTSRAADTGSTECPRRLVSSAHVAESIYRAVARNLDPRIFEKYPIVVVADEGDHWEVGQTNNVPSPKPRPNTVVVTAGGGQLYMNIDKCTGAISDAAFNR